MTLRIKSWHKVLIVKEEDLRGRNLRHGKVLKYICHSVMTSFIMQRHINTATVTQHHIKQKVEDIRIRFLQCIA